MPVRIQKALADAGIASRRQSEDLIRSGRVAIDGRPAIIGESVDPATANIAVDGRTVETVRRLYIALNKPLGVVTTTASDRDERTVMDLVTIPERIYPVGRLDKESCGLLLLTNDGDWADRVMHPRYEVEKEYIVQVRGQIDQHALRRFRAGARVDGKLTVPKKVEPLETEQRTSRLRIILGEGRKREIRVLAKEAGHPVLYLERVRIGHVRLGPLPVGRFRELSREEIEGFRERKPNAARRCPSHPPSGGHRRPGGSGQDDNRRRSRRTPRRSFGGHGVDVSRNHKGRPGARGRSK